MIESGGREGGTKLGVHSCRPDLPADNHVAFPQMAYWTSTTALSNSVKKKKKKYEMHKSRQCDMRERNLAAVAASLSQANDFERLDNIGILLLMIRLQSILGTLMYD